MESVLQFGFFFFSFFFYNSYFTLPISNTFMKYLTDGIKVYIDMKINILTGPTCLVKLTFYQTK